MNLSKEDLHRIYFTFPVENTATFKIQMLNWSARFSICAFLDHNDYPRIRHGYEVLVAADSIAEIKPSGGDPWHQLSAFYKLQQDWLFGHFSYDLKNAVFPFRSRHPDGILFPELFFFCPRIVLWLSDNFLVIGLRKPADEHAASLVFGEIMQSSPNPPTGKLLPVRLQARMDEAAYLASVHAIQDHLKRGDTYEVNFCRECFADDLTMDPLPLFYRLNNASPAPFAAYYRLHDCYLLCASPERFLKKQGSHILSQPIKGTAPRGHTPEEDEMLKEKLRNNTKEKAENVMVVDLVRNDLSHFAVTGSVAVEELFGIYSFAQVHQMISTVTAQLIPDADWVDVIRAAFPMGSMTGAPKHRVLQIIEDYERTKRGLFSGSVGYIRPDGDFDLNVVIRSILYNAAQRYLSFQTGSAITTYSDPEKEWQECQLKASAMRRVLEG